MTTYPLYRVDAFTREAFKGNPAAVMPLPAWLPDETLVAIAAENNLPETAFLVPHGEDFEIRWFTPTVEMPLCGHATLASAFVLFTERGYDRPVIRFHTRERGILNVTRADDGRIVMDFPVTPMVSAVEPDGLASVLGARPLQVMRVKPKGDYLIFLDSAETVRTLTPNIAAIESLGVAGIAVTAQADGGGRCGSRGRYRLPLFYPRPRHPRRPGDRCLAHAPNPAVE